MFEVLKKIEDRSREEKIKAVVFAGDLMVWGVRKRDPGTTVEVARDYDMKFNIIKSEYDLGI